jgi:creatinine amidohydrolase
LVREDQLTAARDGGVKVHDSATRFIHGGLKNYDAIDTSSNGVYGDQTDASREKGKQLFEAALKELEQLLEWLREQPFHTLMAQSHVDPQPGSMSSTD